VKCPKEIFAEICRLNILLSPLCKTDESKAVFQEYETALNELRQRIEQDWKTDKCKATGND